MAMAPVLELRQVCSVCRRPIDLDDPDRAEVVLCGSGRWNVCPCCGRTVRFPAKAYLRRCDRFVREQGGDR